MWFKVLDYVGLYEYFKDLNSVLVHWQKHLFYHLLHANPVRARKEDKEGECVATVCVFPVQAALLSLSHSGNWLCSVSFSLDLVRAV